jgi:type II pantothenate kinase
LTVRSLLDTIEHFLKELDFPDPYLKQKQKENDHALSLLEEHLKKIDQLDWEQRQKQLIVSMLAGNMFDWGAKEVATLMESSDNKFGFEEALRNIPGTVPLYCLYFVHVLLTVLCVVDRETMACGYSGRVGLEVER